MHVKIIVNFTTPFNSNVQLLLSLLTKSPAVKLNITTIGVNNIIIILKNNVWNKSNEFFKFYISCYLQLVADTVKAEG